MKTITTIAKNPRYAEAAAVMSRLVQSHGQAQAEADRTAALLAAWTPPKDTDAVSAALNMLDANTPARRGGMDATAAANTEARNRTDVLRQAIAQQKAEMASLAAELSGEQSNASRADHAAAVQGIADALKALGTALQAEVDLRARIESAGYRCGLQAFTIPDMGTPADPDSLIATSIRDAEAYVTHQRGEMTDEPGKEITVHMLADWPGAGLATEVVVLAGRMARHLVRLGKAEITRDKPRQVAKSRAYAPTVLE